MKVLNAQMDAAIDSLDQDPNISLDKIDKAKKEAREGMNNADSKNSNLITNVFFGILVFAVIAFILYRIRNR